MVNTYLVVASDEGLSGGNWSRAVHFQVRVVIIFYKYLQDVQHLDRLKKKEEGRHCEKQDREGITKEKKDWGLDYL